jgi:hypothetical protein
MGERLYRTAIFAGLFALAGCAGFIQRSEIIQQPKTIQNQIGLGPPAGRGGDDRSRAIVERLLSASLDDDALGRFASAHACFLDGLQPSGGAPLHIECPDLVEVTGGRALSASTDGRHVKISQTLLELVANRDDELAFVVAHELGHILRGHNHANARLLFEGRQQFEFEADSVGLGLVTQAGYRPDAALALLQRWSAIAGGAEHTSSHPPFAERIDRLKVQIATSAAKSMVTMGSPAE